MEAAEQMSVFKSYLRRLLRDLQDLQEALNSNDTEKAKEIVDNLVDDTQSGIEDS